jgi:hypothetical protein
MHSLRITVQRLEENFASPEDKLVVSELKRNMLLHIADFEALREAEASDAAPEPTTASETHRVQPVVEQSLEPALANELEITESASDSIETA